MPCEHQTKGTSLRAHNGFSHVAADAPGVNPTLRVLFGGKLKDVPRLKIASQWLLLAAGLSFSLWWFHSWYWGCVITSLSVTCEGGGDK